MKKTILALIIGLLAMGVNAYAADGDFIVDGNLGIGIDEPTVELDVNGSINLSPSGTIKQNNIPVFFTNHSNESIFIGYQVFREGIMNTAVGTYALLSSYGDFNTAVGRSALQSNTTGGYNTAFGVASLVTNETGFFNTAIGATSLLNNTIGNENTSLGFFALFNATEGNNNIAIGKGAGENITTGSNNIIIGYEIDAPDPVGSNQLSIGNLIFGTGINGTDTIISSGNIGIGTNDPQARLDVDGDLIVSGAIRAGSICYHNCPSDALFKDNIIPIQSSLHKIMNLQGVSFNWKKGDYKGRYFPDGKHYGVLAQDVEKVIPELVMENRKGEKSVSYTELIPVLIEAVKEQQKIIEKQNKNIDDLKVKVQKLEAKDYMVEALR